MPSWQKDATLPPKIGERTIICWSIPAGCPRKTPAANGKNGAPMPAQNTWNGNRQNAVTERLWKTPGPTASRSPKRRKSKVCALFGAGLRKTQSIRSGFPTCLICKNTGDPAADAVVIYRLIACAALLKKEALGSLSWIIFWQCFRFYPTRCRLSSRILSAIIAMNSELVGLPRRLWMV